MTVRSIASSVLTASAAAFAFGVVACDKSPPPKPETTSAATEKASTAPTTAEDKTIRASGSSALQPLINAAKEKFEAANAGKSVEVSAGGSKKGLSDVASGAVQIGNSDIPAPADMTGLVDHKVAVVGFAAMANKGAYDEKVTSISKDDLAKIFQGKITNWKELGGTSQPIVVINRAAGSGTRSVFGSVVLGGDTFVESQTEDNSGALVAKLKQTKGAISYLALSFKEPELLTISLKGEGGKAIEPTDDAILAGTYPIWTYEHMFTKGEATGTTKSFLDFVLSPGFQEQTLPTVKGFLPITKMKAAAK